MFRSMFKHLLAQEPIYLIPETPKSEDTPATEQPKAEEKPRRCLLSYTGNEMQRAYSHAGRFFLM